MELSLLGSTPTALPCNQLKPVFHRTHDNRLKHAPLGNGRGKLVDRLFVENLSRLRRIRPNSSDLHHPDAARRNRIRPWDRWSFTDQCAEPPPQPRCLLHAATAVGWGNR